MAVVPLAVASVGADPAPTLGSVRGAGISGGSRFSVIAVSNPTLAAPAATGLYSARFTFGSVSGQVTGLCVVDAHRVVVFGTASGSGNLQNITGFSFYVDDRSAQGLGPDVIATNSFTTAPTSCPSLDSFTPFPIRSGPGFPGFDVHVPPYPDDFLAVLQLQVVDVPPGHALSDDISAARAALAAGDTKSACRALADFDDLVAAQSGKTLDPSDASTWSAYAESASAGIPC
jgi:hypothetical protein